MKTNLSARARAGIGALLASGVAAATVGVLTTSVASAATETSTLAVPVNNLGFGTSAITSETAGTLDNGVSWTRTDVGTFGCGSITWDFDQVVDLRFGVNGVNTSADGGEGVIVPAGTVAESVAPEHEWTEGELRVRRRTGNQTATSVFRLDDVDQLTVTGAGACQWIRNIKFLEVSVEVPDSVDLAIAKEATDPVLPGETITWTITVTNNGPHDSSGYTVTDELPAEVESATTSTPGCGFAGNTLTCTGDALAVGESDVITAEGTVAPGTPLGTTVTNSADVAGNEADPDLSNNSASATTVVFPDCIEDGLELLDGAVASNVVHDPVEDIVAALLDPVAALLGIPLSDLVHDLNCGLVAPVEDAVDTLLVPILGPVTKPLGGLLKNLL